jgi:hypothetical protein
MDAPPRLGDVVGLTPWLPDRPFRVLDVRNSGIDGHSWIHGYLIDELPRTES